MDKKKVNIILLNYNGRELLRKYLPSAVEASKNSKHNCRVSVIDNRSVDGSIKFVMDNFKDVIVYKAKENKVLCSYNDYLKEIDDDIVIFLNTDIKVDVSFVDPLIEHFDDKDLLFVAPKELSMEGNYQGNLNKLRFKFGILSTIVNKEGHERLQNDISVHGGAFDRKKFLKLGGYDNLYLPGIVEDLDLCYRGWKHGWKGLYEPKSFYYHEGSTTFNAEYGRDGKLLLAHRNTFLFFWKNVTSMKMILKHILFIPPLLIGALLRGRLIFIEGFFHALRGIPLVLQKRREASSQFILSDEDVIEKAEGNLHT